MPYFLSFLLFSLFLTPAFLQAAKKKVEVDATPFVGYRQDNLEWKTSTGNTEKWKNLQGIEYGIKSQTTLKDRYKIYLDFYFANFLSGTMTDLNYLAASGSGNPSKNSINGKGFAFRPNIAFGFNMKPLKCLDLIPVIGYAYDYLNLTKNKNATSALSSLSNTLQWNSPYIGINSKTRFNKRLSMTAGAAFNLAFYQGSGHWRFQNNGTKNTMSQGGNGIGLMGQVGLNYLLVKSVAVGAEADIRWDRVNQGHDRRHFANGTTAKSKLNNVNWTTFATRLTLTKTF